MTVTNNTQWRRLSLEEIKEHELMLLKQFAQYCDDNDLCYTLAGGTLLGAVRHKGFIPWDDDIDVMMPRPDYERFILEQEKEKIFKFVCITNNSTSYPFMKILDDSVKLDVEFMSTPEAENLWIDIFPIDGLPEDEAASNAYYRKALALKYMQMASMARQGRGTTRFKAIAKIPICVLCRCIGRYRIARWSEKYSKRIPFDESQWVGGISWGYGPQERMPREQWLKRTRVEFEGALFWAPGCWERYLRNLFGDYMQLPPEEKRVAHGMSAWILDDMREDISA